jgi:Zn-dependent M16 (insulinase) family peptidase
MYEHLYGYEYHTFIKRIAHDVDDNAEYILSRFKDINDKYFRRERLTLGVTEADGADFAKKIVGIIHTGGSKGGKTPVKPLKKMNEGIAVPTTVSFCALGANLDELGENLFSGSFSVYQSIASLEILWNEIRVKNGAYDAGYTNSPTGALSCHTYRDPSPEASIACFKRLPEDMDAFINTSPDLKKYIIGVFGASDPITTPRSEGALGTSRHLTGRVHEDFVKRRKQCLETTLDDLRAVNAIVAKGIEGSTFTVVGPRDALEKMKNLDRILDI